MHLDLIESLRCPGAHDDGWLVAVPDVVVDRVMQSGEIGCPRCGATWRVRRGVLALTTTDAAPATAAAPEAARSESVPSEATRSDAAPPHAARGSVRAEPDPAAEALRTAALLDLRTPGGTVLLAGHHVQHATALAALVPDVLVLALNAPDGARTVHGDLRANAPLPLGVGTLRGARLDEPHATAEWLPGVVRAIARGGRLVAPANAPLPDTTRERARDAHEWVADVQVAASGLVPLRRGGDPMRR